ncbi:hypothetical protein ACTWPT_06660 [Nonomuraea sp. 3N208]
MTVGGDHAPGDPDPFRPLPPAAGLGCHSDPARALVAALADKVIPSVM